MQSLLTNAQKAQYQAALDDVFATFATPLTVYLEGRTVVVNTQPDFAGQFGDQSQNAVSTVVTPQCYTVSGCVQYGNKQPWDYVEVGSRGNWHQDKIRESFGTVRLKVDASGNSLMMNAKQARLDGFTFNIVSTPRPHGLVGAPVRWTYILQKVD